jgi:GNAT superfamily N-acetyltransferase
MLDDLVRRWQAGRSVSRGWTDTADDHGVIVLRIGDPERMVSYLAADRDLDHAAHLAQTDDHPPGLSWLSVVTNDPEDVLPRIKAAGLDYRRTEWLMWVQLEKQPVLRAPAPYGVEVVQRGEVLRAEIRAEQYPVARGQMVVAGNDAIVDMVWTEPQYRRQGLAGAVMSTLVTEARAAGATIGLLAASPEGRQLYQSLGWTTFASIHVACTPGESEAPGA